MTIGESLLICSIYRASLPGSKRAFSEWFFRTSLSFLLGFNPIGLVGLFFSLSKEFEYSVRLTDGNWTDHKIKVNTFYCLIGLILTGPLYKKEREKGINIKPEKLLERLKGKREVLNNRE